jgi:polyisoprenoid-binding protein YceI
MKWRILFCGALLAAPLVASAAEFQIDPNHSAVGFKIRHLVSRVPGQFHDFSGTVDFDEKHPEKSRVNAVIQAASIDTRVERRDKDLRSAHFFEVDKYPTLSFASTKVRQGKDGHLTLEGKLTMHGVSKPVSLDVEKLGEQEFMGKKHVGFEAHGTLDRKDYGIVWNKALDSGGTLLGDEVQLELQIEAVEAGD